MRNAFQIITLTALVAVWVSGCATTPAATTIAIDPKTSFTVPVDLVGITDENLPDIMGYDVDKYWSPSDAFRKTADRFQVQVSGGKAVPPELSMADPIWAKWIGSGVTHLVIIADLRGDDFKGLGRLDPRRVDINLKDRYVSNSIVVEVRDKAVKVVTPKKH